MPCATLPPAAPEALGIPSGAIMRLIERLNHDDYFMHGLLIARHGQLAAEGYWKPFDALTPHLMFSVTKSFTSLAIGFLADEGRLKLDDSICDYFPEKLPPEGAHPYVQAMTIRHILTMCTAHEGTTFKKRPEDDWVHSFLTYPPSHLPGRVFSYDTSGTHCLAALVQRCSGENLFDYLRPRLLEPLGFDTGRLYCWKDPMGIDQGGSGLHCLPIDLVKLGVTCLNHGVWQGRQVIPAWYLAEATSRQVDNTASAMCLEGQQGYGYFFWRTRHGGYACYGMGGQFMLCLPEEDLVLVTTANTLRYANDHQKILDAFFDTLYPALEQHPLPADEAGYAALRATLDSLALPVRQGAPGPREASLNAQQYPLGPNDMGLTRARFDFDGDEGCYEFETATHKYKLAFGLGKMVEGTLPGYGHRYVASAAWQDENTLLIDCHLLGDVVGTLAIQASFGERDLTLFMREYGANNYPLYSGFASGSRA